MTKRDLERQRLFSIVAYSDHMTSAQARVIYLKEHGDISMLRVNQVLCEMAEDGTLERPAKGIYRRPT